MANSDLAKIAALNDSTSRIMEYSALLQKAISESNDTLLSQFVDHVADETVPQSTAHLLLAEFADLLPSLDSEKHKVVAEHALRALTNRVHSFEAEIVALRVGLAKCYEEKHEWTLAARTLAGIPFDGSARVLTGEFLVEQYVKIARFLIEDENYVDAENYIARASFAMPHCTDEGVKLMHRVSSARLLDSKRKFEEAARKYNELSQARPGTYGTSVITEDDCRQALNFAITCAILAPAGPRRSRILAILYNDERSRDLPVFPMLESIYMGRLLKQEQIDSFRPTLQPHQLASHSDGSTVLDRAVTEHNLSAASRLYTNIRLDELGILLGVSADKAESVCRDMAAEGRMQASIDQVSGVVEFETPGTRSELERWDSQIEDICASVDECSDAILKAFPQLAAM